MTCGSVAVEKMDCGRKSSNSLKSLCGRGNASNALHATARYRINRAETRELIRVFVCGSRCGRDSALAFHTYRGPIVPLTGHLAGRISPGIKTLAAALASLCPSPTTSPAMRTRESPKFSNPGRRIDRPTPEVGYALKTPGVAPRGLHLLR